MHARSSVIMSEGFKHQAVPATDVFKPDLFKGKVVLVTGGGSGICYGITDTLMKLGAKAAIVGRNAERLHKAAATLSKRTGSEAIATPGDVRKFEAMEEVVKQTVAKFGKIDMVICGAAGNFMAPLVGLSSNAFRTVIEIDLMGTYNTVRATAAEIKKAHGSYIHISATLHYSGLPWQAAPSAAKAGIDVLSNVIAVEWGPMGVRSNCVAPGVIAGTEGAERLVPKGSEDLVDGFIPMQRMGQRADIANACVFLFSDAANWINGQVIVRNRKLTAGCRRRPHALPRPMAALSRQLTRPCVVQEPIPWPPCVDCDRYASSVDMSSTLRPCFGRP